MVSLFGLKFGGDKRKNKDVADPAALRPSPEHEEWERTRPSYKDAYISPYAALQGDTKETSSRPRTAQGSVKAKIHPGNGGLYVGGHLMASSMTSLHDSDFRGVAFGILGTAASVSAGPIPRPGSRASQLKAARSEANLRSEYLLKNISATSLAAPPPTSKLGDRTNSLTTAPRPSTATTRLGDSTTSLNTAQRPSTAHSMRHFGQGSSSHNNSSSSSISSSSGITRKTSLEINLGATADISTPTFGTEAPPRSPLGQYALASPVKSDTASLFGSDSPEKVAEEITSRIAREEEMAKARVVNEERRRVQAELEAQRRRNVEATRPTTSASSMAYPSPPASIEGESEKSMVFGPGRRPSPRLQGGPLPQDFRRPGPGPRGQVPMYGPPGRGQRLGPGPGPGPVPRPQPSPRPQVTTTANDGRTRSRGGQVPRENGSAASPRLPPPGAVVVREQDVVKGANMNPPQRDGSQSRKAPTLQTLSIPATTAATTTTDSAARAPLRSPLFQQMHPFDVHSDDDENDEHDGKESTTVIGTQTHTNTATAEDRRAPYGIPSPPLSHRQRPSDEHEAEEEIMPMIQTVQAKRDTMVVGGPGRTSLGLQIEEFERTLQQAQAMSALENKVGDLGISDAVGECFGAAAAAIATNGLFSGTRGRADSNGSSNYSEMSESPMYTEPPLVSPKPFPLSPRPIGPAIRSHPAPANQSPLERPSLEVGSERTFGPYRRETDDSTATAGRRPTLEERPESLSMGVVRPCLPRPGAAAGLHRPTMEEYGSVKVHNSNNPATRVQRPSPHEYGPVRIKRTDSPFQSDGSVSVSSGIFRMDSPILQVVRHGHGHGTGHGSVDSGSGGGSSTSNSIATSRTNSPVPTSTGSYSVFSPPPPPQHSNPSSAAAVATVKRTLTLQTSSSSSLTGFNSSQHQQQPEWYGPAPTAPPTSPLPIPEQSVSRKNTLEMGTAGGILPPFSSSHSQQQAAPASLSKLASSATIVPDMDANPNWPLPGPSAFVFPPPASAAIDTTPKQTVVQQLQPSSPPPVAVESGFAARRSLLRDKRAPPAPLNIAATKYADEVLGGGGDMEAGPWTPDVAALLQKKKAVSSSSSSSERKRILPALSILTTTNSGDHDGAMFAEEPQSFEEVGMEEDKSATIGIARGLSIRYDRMKQEERQRGRTRTRQPRPQMASAGWRLDEEEHEAEGPLSPTTTTTTTPMTKTTSREPFDRLRRPNHGLKSPTGIADEQGIRFI